MIGFSWRLPALWSQGCKQTVYVQKGAIDPLSS
jgi:hypothetical protein